MRHYGTFLSLGAEVQKSPDRPPEQMTSKRRSYLHCGIAFSCFKYRFRRFSMTQTK